MKLLKKITLVLFVSLLTFSCSSSDDSDDGGLLSVNHPDSFSGELVPVAQRNLALTGSNTLNKSSSTTIKWWNAVEAAEIISGCGEDDYTDTYDASGVELSFGTDGVMYRKENGSSAQAIADWNWTDGNKTSVNWYIYELGESAVFNVTYLNYTDLVYYRSQSQGNCSYREYLKLVN